MMTASDIKNKALECGACELINSTDSIADLVALMKTPQGKEFCKKYSFPTLEMLREHKDEIVSMDVYVDAGDIEVQNVDDLIVAGDTNVVASYDRTDKPYHVMVMHGAKANVCVSDYAVCTVCLAGGSAEATERSYASVFVK